MEFPRRNIDEYSKVDISFKYVFDNLDIRQSLEGLWFGFWMHEPGAKLAFLLMENDRELFHNVGSPVSNEGRKSRDFMAVMENLAFIEERTGSIFEVPSEVSPDDLGKVQLLSSLLRTGKWSGPMGCVTFDYDFDDQEDDLLSRTARGKRITVPFTTDFKVLLLGVEVKIPNVTGNYRLCFLSTSTRAALREAIRSGQKTMALQIEGNRKSILELSLPATEVESQA